MARGMLHVFHTLDAHTSVLDGQTQDIHDMDRSVTEALKALDIITRKLEREEREGPSVVYVVVRMDDSDQGQFWEVYDSPEGAENEILFQKQQRHDPHEFRMYASQVLHDKGE